MTTLENLPDPSHDELVERTIDIETNEYGRKARKKSEELGRLTLLAEHRSEKRDKLMSKSLEAEDGSVFDGRLAKLDAKAEVLARQHYAIAVEEAAIIHPEWAEGPAPAHIEPSQSPPQLRLVEND